MIVSLLTLIILTAIYSNSINNEKFKKQSIGLYVLVPIIILITFLFRYNKNNIL